MTTITFDTLELTDALKQSGIEQQQAEAIEAQGELVTRDYLDIKIAPISADLMLLKWMLGVLLVGVLSLILKAFF